MSNSWCKAQYYHIAHVLQKAPKPLFPLLAWVTAERHVSSDERRRLSLRRIWLTLSDSSVPGQFRHTDIKHIKCLSQHFTWHCSSALICYPETSRLLSLLQVWDQDCVKQQVKRSCNEREKKNLIKSDLRDLEVWNIKFPFELDLQRQFSTLMLFNCKI